MTKTIVIALILILPLVGIPEGAQAYLSEANLQVAGQPNPAGTGKIAPEVQVAMQSLPAGEMIPVIVTLVDQADLSRIPGASRAARQQGVIRALQAMAETSQKQILAFLEAQAALGNVMDMDVFWVFNGLSVTATQEVIQELAARADVQRITPDEIPISPAQLPGPAEPNLSVVNAPSLWDLGLYGQGIVVANMDSGVDVSHPDLASRWRGGTNSWFDPYGQHPDTPTDFSGHGTWTMGVMVGGDAGGSSVGVAPQAQWIAVKIFDDQSGSTATAIHQGFQWLLDPDGDPSTADAPHIVNNSWTFAYPGCDLEFELDLQSLRAAGILPVFAAGNGGPSAGTSYSPANNPSAFAVGATDNSGLVYAASSRGPSSCGEPISIFPELVAPGVGIRTTGLYGLYAYPTGTSLAAPHVAGGLALLLGAFPELMADEQEAALISSAVDLGPLGADGDFGYGRLDLLAAYQWLLTAPTPTPTPDPDLNLALNKPVMVSSSQDSSHGGEMAVDGDQGTFWQTMRAKGKDKLSTEWITVDLGSSMSVGRIVLEWDNSFATSYDIQLSSDGSTWTTVYSVINGDGGTDTMSFSSVQARYVRMESTAWSSDSSRNWLREYEIYAGGGGPAPTPAPTPTPGSGTTMHIGDLDGASAQGNRGRWDATITIMVHDASEDPLADATVSGTWDQGASGSDSCVTDVYGTCSVSKRNLKSGVSSVTFTVTTVTHASASYTATVNHDPDGDSDGTSMTVSSP